MKESPGSKYTRGAFKLLPILGILVSLGCIFFIFYRLDFGVFKESFRGLNIFWAGAMVVIYLAGFLVRGWRWHVMLLPTKNIHPRVTTEGVVIGYMANNIFPARAGEVIRALILGARESVSKATALGTIAVERIFDGLVIVGILILCSFIYDDPRETGSVHAVFILGTIIFGGACLFILLGYYCSAGIRRWVDLASRHLPANLGKKFNEITCNLLGSLEFFKSGRHVYLVLFSSVLVWAVEGLVFWVGFLAFGIEPSLLAAYFTLALVNLAMLIPSGPGGIGLFQEASILALAMFGIPAEKAFSYSVVVHGAMIVPITILGSLILSRYGISLRSLGKGHLGPVPGVLSAEARMNLNSGSAEFPKSQNQGVRMEMNNSPVNLEKKAWPRARMRASKLFSGSVPKYLLLFLLLWGIFLALGKNSLDTPFHHDALHLVRSYSGEDILNAWRGKWDPDGIETPGYRPLTTLFYHVEGSIFGESPRAHRIFLLALFSLFLTLTVALCSVLWGVSLGIGILASVISFLHINNFIHYTWISDGIHLICEIYTIGSVLTLLLFLKKGRAFLLAASFLSAAAGLFTRESGLIAYPLLALFGWAYWLHYRPGGTIRWRPLVLYGIALSALLVLFWSLRSIYVPDRLALRPSWMGYLWSLKEIFLYFGDPTHLVVWMQNYLVIQSLFLFLLGIITVFFFLSSRPIRTRAAWLLLAMLIAAAPGFTLARSNLLLLPITFFSFFIALIIVEFSRKSLPRSAMAVLISLLIISSGAKVTYEILQEQRSANLDWVDISTEWVYGKYSTGTIPAPRLDIVKAQLNQLGISSVEDRDRKLPLMIHQSVEKRWHAGEGGHFFIPKFRWLIGPDWKSWSRVGREICVSDSAGALRLCCLH